MVNRPHVAMLQMIDMKPWGKGQRMRRTTVPTKAWEGLKYWKHWSGLEKLPYGRIWRRKKKNRLEGMSQISMQRKVPCDPSKV